MAMALINASDVSSGEVEDRHGVAASAQTADAAVFDFHSKAS